MNVLYEDEQLIAVNKSWSDVVQADRAGSPTLLERVRQRRETPFLGLVHRLDRPTSGVVLFARCHRMLVRMNELFRARRVRKIYWAVVAEPPPRPQPLLPPPTAREEDHHHGTAPAGSPLGLLREDAGERT